MIYRRRGVNRIIANDFERGRIKWIILEDTSLYGLHSFCRYKNIRRLTLKSNAHLESYMLKSIPHIMTVGQDLVCSHSTSSTPEFRGYDRKKGVVNTGSTYVNTSPKPVIDQHFISEDGGYSINDVTTEGGWCGGDTKSETIVSNTHVNGPDIVGVWTHLNTNIQTHQPIIADVSLTDIDDENENNITRKGEEWLLESTSPVYIDDQALQHIVKNITRIVGNMSNYNILYNRDNYSYKTLVKIFTICTSFIGLAIVIALGLCLWWRGSICRRSQTLYTGRYVDIYFMLLVCMA